jgi:hypothetical protein
MTRLVHRSAPIAGRYPTRLTVFSTRRQRGLQRSMASRSNSTFKQVSPVALSPAIAGRHAPSDILR